MGQPAQIYYAPWCYNALVVNGNAGAALTLRQMIVALSGGKVPDRLSITGFLAVPSADIRMIGGYKPSLGAFVTAVQGGGYLKLPLVTGGYALDISDPLDNIAWLMDGAGAGTMDVALFTDGG